MQVSQAALIWNPQNAAMRLWRSLHRCTFNPWDWGCDEWRLLRRLSEYRLKHWSGDGGGGRGVAEAGDFIRMTARRKRGLAWSVPDKLGLCEGVLRVNRGEITEDSPEVNRGLALTTLQADDKRDALSYVAFSGISTTWLEHPNRHYDTSAACVFWL